ncbi:hypothetical protein CMQ_242 [Grosmannia clavigera kw1407]|uniref:Uncharacterized protein n=1 Tax=Grosmannia clavigera (strain kw1407 / UAMH 11150) TaxID=655863 RepID=F0XQV8_GROCL|nr:uncharacterized protein CMQ_242 [Grosmannia clavigera kw1407]EFW99924.1 hypothetical protein CMQ_242 [Grosmannia clavigera kw1407]
MHPKSGNASASSPAEIMKSAQPDKKKHGNQKRVPKRSILDPPETPDTEQIDSRVESFSKLLEVPQSTTVHTSATKPFLSSVVKPMKREPRQRKERFPIVITSDSGASSDDYGSCNDKTTSMLQHSRPPLITTSPHPQRRMSHILPVELEEEAETFNTALRQPRTNTKPNRNLPKRGRAKAAPRTQNVESYKKRELSPTTTIEDIREGKKTKLEPPQKPDHDVIMEHPQPVKVRENPKVLRTAVVSDPFLAKKDDSSTCLTEFTAKLLNTASRPESVEPVRFQAESTAIQTGLFLRRIDSTQEQVEPSGIAREMIEALESAAPPKTGSRTRSLHKRSGTESAKDTWLNQADPYKATSQIMSYVCTTILRFLKSKEAAIEDVAKEYLQRGEVVIKRIKTLHDSERVDVCRKFELCRLGSLHIFEEAQRDIRVISSKLERIDVSNSVKNMLMDDTVSRLRELQAKIV